MRKPRLADVSLPEFGIPYDYPEMPANIFAGRLARLRDRVEHSGLDALVIYADREHCANIAWLTGFDPRFE